MKIKDFTDIVSWQLAQELYLELWIDLQNLNDFTFRDQILRATLSISNNIAEGFERYSNKEFVRFLLISKASSAEVRSMLYLSEKIHYLTKDKSNLHQEKVFKMKSYLTALIKSSKQSI